MNLAPCPFCGGKQPGYVAVWVDQNDQHCGLRHMVVCRVQSCVATGPTFLQLSAEDHIDHKQHAIDAWNRRVMSVAHLPSILGGKSG